MGWIVDQVAGASASAWQVRAVLLPDGTRVRDRWLGAGCWDDEPVPGAELLPGRFALPGLVDAHSHVSLAQAADGPVLVDAAGAEANRARQAADGVALLRDAGGAPEVVLPLPQVPGRPHLVAAGRHLAPRGLYFEAVHRPAESDEVVDIALAELVAGAKWVKLVADFVPAPARAAGAWHQAQQTYDFDVVSRLVSAVHNAGARVAAHVTLPLVADLVRLGVDSVEHGTALDEDTLAEMGRRGIAWTPTLCATLSAPPDAPAERLRLVAERRERFGALLPAAIRHGVPVLTGSDVVGSVPREVALLTECGLSPLEALKAATTNATRFLGAEAATAPPAVVTYHADPRNDPAVLTQPAAVVIGGVRVR
jgi:imidazolonepropionase-like amidohydrolase